MRGYVMVGTNDLKLSEEFYDELLETVGLKKIYIDDFCIGYSQQKDSNEVEFYITKPANGKPATFGNGTQISFLTDTRKQVEKFHTLGIEIGGTSEGMPGTRPEGASTYYSYIRDPFGHKICAYTNSED
jgi:catechol 2,3-dioxygenase-like lactoylglutathione lyase family enzyme